MNAAEANKTAAPEPSPIRRWSQTRRLRAFRRLVPCQARRSRDLVVKGVETVEERSAAFRLLHDEYVRAELTDVEESGMRITPYHLLPTTSVFIAVKRGVVVGTVSLIRRTPSGVPAERLFDLSLIFEDGGTVEEISSLAVARLPRSDGEILFSLFRFALKNSIRRSVEHWVATFHPRHRHLYEEILGFESLEQREVKSYDFVNGAPAMAARLEVQRFPRTLAALYGEHTPHTPYTFLREGEDIECEPENVPALVVA